MQVLRRTGGDSFRRFFFVLGDHFNLVCMTCFDDLLEFVRRPENAVLDFAAGVKAAPDKAETQLAELQRRQDEFVNERVLRRKSK